MLFCCELIGASTLGDRSIGIWSYSRIAVSTGTSSGNLQSPVPSICDLRSARPGVPALRPYLDEFWGWPSPKGINLLIDLQARKHGLANMGSQTSARKHRPANMGQSPEYPNELIRLPRQR